MPSAFDRRALPAGSRPQGLDYGRGLAGGSRRVYYHVRGRGGSPVSRLDGPIARLGERLQGRLKERRNTFREAILSPDIFCVTWEQIPGRGAFEMQQEEVIENAGRAAQRQGSRHQCYR
jgi:hypothetical protein